MSQALLKPQELVVSTYDEFVMWVEEKPDRHRKAAHEKMLNLANVLDGSDPLMYLYDLYYNQTKSLVEILKSPEISDIEFFSKATLHRLLFERFGWIPRENTQRTPVHEEKLSRKTAQEIREFESKVAGLIGGREVERVFRMQEFKEKRYRIGKALYILKTLGGINKNILYKLSVEGGLSHAVLARSLNKELEEILKRYPELGIEFENVQLYPQSINRWFQYNSEQYEKASE